MKISVVVCIKNEEKRIEACLQSIAANTPDEIIVVDGNSSDRSVEICKKYTDRIISAEHSNLTRDRQMGIDAARNEIIAMIDADHRLKPGDLAKLYEEMERYQFDMIQSQLVSHQNHNWLNRAEEQMWALNHNIPGEKSMIGVAPALYKKKIFECINFDDTITSTIDDTDFVYRLSLNPQIKFGIGETPIAQLHDASFRSYMRKFRWYGIGDGEFCVKHKSRRGNMLFHLFIRYPILYSLRALVRGKLQAIPYLMLQGYTRGFWALRRIIRGQ